jgi:6-phosphogluconolactonase
VGSYADAHRPGIYAFGFDSDAGVIEARATYAGIANPSFLVVHPIWRCLYAVSELSAGTNGASGSVCAFQFESESGVLQPINRQSSGGGAPCHLALDISGRWLVVSNYAGGTICVLPITEDGALAEPTHLVQNWRKPTHPGWQEEPHAHSATFAPDGRFVLVADLGLDQIVVYAFDAKAGRLGRHGHVNARPGAGPRHLAFHPGGLILYAANELDSTISVYEYDAVTGYLRGRQSLPTLPSGAPENSVADIHIAPDGARLYVSNRGHDSIAVFDIGAEGALTGGAIQPSGGRWPRNFALEPSGRFMLIANQYSGNVAVLPLLDNEAGLGGAMAWAAVPAASCVQFVESQT